MLTHGNVINMQMRGPYLQTFLWAFTMGKFKYRKFSNKGATPYRGAPPPFVPSLLGFRMLSQPKKVRFSICIKPLEDEIALSLMRAPPKGSLMRPVPLLGNLPYSEIMCTLVYNVSMLGDPSSIPCRQYHGDGMQTYFIQ